MEKQEILDRKWDNLIVLDACRYDYFKTLGKDYFSKIDFVESPVSTTPEWLKKVFTGRYDNIKYISANPYVNSKGVSTKDKNEDFDYWNAVEHFKKENIVDAWESCWSSKLGTTNPKDVYKLALNEADAERNIIHFMKPHIPYLLREQKSSIFSEIYNRIKKNFRMYGGILKKTLKMKRQLTGSYIEVIAKTESLTELRKCYTYNCEEGIRYANKLKEKLDGKTVITADHGEMLGEDSIFGHGIDDKFNRKEIHKVPWCC